MPLKPIAVAPAFKWNSTAGRANEGRYVDAAGRFVSRANVRTAIDGTIESSAANVKVLTEQLRTGAIDTNSWRNGMMQEIRLSHLAQATAAKGGFDQMTPADNGRAGQAIRVQYDYIRNFANEVDSGKQKLDGTLGRRANMYAEASRDTYEATAKATMRGRGMARIRNVLHPADHCAGCLDETAKGWMDIDAQPPGGMVPIGQRQCLTRCKCTAEYQTADGTVTG